MKSSGTCTEPMVHPESSLSTPPTSRLVTIAERSGSFDESVGYSDTKEDDDEEYLEEKAAMPDLSEAAVVSVDRSGAVRSLARNLIEELNDVAGPEPATEDSGDVAVGDDWEGNFSVDRQPATSQWSNWMQLFGPKPVRQAVWMDLGVAQDTVLLPRDMGCEPPRFPSDAALKDWTPTDAGTALRKWKKKLRTSIGVSEIGAGRQPLARRAPEAADPSKVPLPQTPKKRVSEGSDAGVFTATAEASPYMQDSHMVTQRSASRSERLAEETESLRPTPNTRQETGRRPARNYDSPEDSSDSDSDSGDIDYLGGDLTEEWARQIRELNKAETKSSTPRLKLAIHLPLGNIKPYFGLRNKSEKSMQWLRTFIYEVKGTHTPPNEWCMAFELSLQDGALCWYRQLPRKTRRTWKLLSDAFIKYYCSRFTQSAKARYYSAKREDKEHVCDYLNRLNGYARNAGVQFENGGRDAKDHVEHFLDTVTVANALTELVAALNMGDTTRSRSNRPETRQHGYDGTETSSDDERRRDGSRGPSKDSDSDSSLDGEYGHVAAANDSESRAAAEGTFARSDHRHPKGDNGHFNKDRSYGQNNRQRQRCKLCKQVHDVGKCDALNELTNLLRSKVDKKDLTPELQNADYMFAFASEVNWPEDREITSVTAMETEKERCASLSECGMKEWSTGESSGRKTEALVKITLGWERVCEFEMRIMNHSAGVDVVLGTDFMIPAGVRLDLFHGAAILPDEVMVPLIKSLSAGDDEPYVTQYKEWQILAYAESRDKTLFEREHELYECWLAEQPPAVERREYPTPRNILTRDAEDSAGNVANATIRLQFGPLLMHRTAQQPRGYRPRNDSLYTEPSNGVTSENTSASDQMRDKQDNRAAYTPCLTEDPEGILNATYVSAMHEIAAGVVSGRDAEKDGVSEHLATDIELTDYAQELAFLPDLTEIAVTALDYAGPNVQNKDLDMGQQQKLVDVLKRHEKIMISSGYALPPPAYGVVCDIDVQGHAPIKQRARRTPLRFFGKLYELLKGLLPAGLITFSDSPWASPIVIVLNGVDIRLCIDYKMVNAVTAIIEYAMPLVDDLLTDFTPGGDLTVAKRSFAAIQQKVMDAPILRHFDRDKEVHVMLFANEWALSSTLTQEHDGRLHPVRFCGPVLKDAEMSYHLAEKEILALLLLLKVCYTQLAGRTIHVYARFSTLDWVHKSKTLFGRTTQFAVMLSPWHLVVQRVKERDCSFAQLLQAGLTSFVDLDDSLAQVAPPTKGSPSIRMDPNLLYARLPRSYQGFVLSFDDSAKAERHGGYGSCAWILWSLPEWTIVTAASAYLEATTVNLAEYAGMNNGVQAALEHTTVDLVIVGDSRLVIQQSLGVIACRKESLLTQLNRHRELTAKFRSVTYLHVVREFNAAADSLASETLESKVSKVVSIETRLSELTTLNRIQDAIYEPTAKAETEDKPSINTVRAHLKPTRSGTDLATRPRDNVEKKRTVKTKRMMFLPRYKTTYEKSNLPPRQLAHQAFTHIYAALVAAIKKTGDELPRTKS
ncbi:Hypothetical protein PHPALM_1377 [Phytophthora palmivora]|uniref:RNase H type-1 domain-containing protein n=1 Tax=Phytophthora palmivora TaxID=4796 RepID=A0A2P4YSF1_9STRA|nr:Hypothetical protein PHPALM_1377 [Phytophthora palmivora]